MTFSAKTVNDYVSSDVDEILSKVNRDGYTWIGARLHDVPTMTRILDFFELPPSLAEQIESANPIEAEAGVAGYLLKKFRFIARTDADPVAPAPAEPSFLIRKDETERYQEIVGTVVLGKTFLLSFEDHHTAQLAKIVRTEILSGKVTIQGIDHLVYRLTRALFVDNYLAQFRRIMDRIQDTEAVLLQGSTDADVYRDVIRRRRELNPFERSVLYASDFTEMLIRETPAVLGQASFSHIAENLMNDSGKLEKEFVMLRDRTSELIQMYRDNVNTQLNNTMRTLAVISALFLPLSFITGFFGMNFFADSLAFQTPLPKALLFAGSLLIMCISPSLMWNYARGRKWF
jgi:Mg2+ and Co2+ transporter CorA